MNTLTILLHNALDFQSYYLLSLGLMALAMGPVIYRLAQNTPLLLSTLDGFVLVAVTGLTLLYILPHSILIGGWPALILSFIGLLAPTLIEHKYHRLAHQAHTVTLILAILGMSLHGFIDGLALINHGTAAGDHAVALPWAVILHRLPEGITVWWLIRPQYGSRKAIVTLVFISLITIFGFSFWDSLQPSVENQWIAAFQSLIAGSLLHVIFHRATPHKSVLDSEKNRFYSGIGALLAMSALFLFHDSHSHGGVFSHDAKKTGQVFLSLVLEAAPALVFAYLCAGLIQAFLPKASVAWMKRGSALTQSSKGMIFGLPLPICSCGVLPVYRSLILQGVPATAAMAFLVATPELGIDAFLLSLPMLGFDFTILRLCAAGSIALLTGFCVGRFTDTQQRLQKQNPLEEGTDNKSVLTKLKSSFVIGFGEVVDHTGPWILIGIAIAALLDPILGDQTLLQISPFWQIPFFTLLGMPLYVCASGATPLVAVLMAKGLSPGAAIAFLLTGPATNVTTFGFLSELHGKKIALFFAAAIALFTMALGYGINFFWSASATPVPHYANAETGSIWQFFSVAFLAILIALSLLRQGPRRFIGQIISFDVETDEHDHDHHLESQT